MDKDKKEEKKECAKKGGYMSGGANCLSDSCQSCFSGVHLVLSAFRDIRPSNKENPSVYWHATLSCPFLASKHATSYLVPISFWMLTMPWIFFSDLAFQACISFCSVLDKVAPECFGLVRLKVPLLICIQAHFDQIPFLGSRKGTSNFCTLNFFRSPWSPVLPVGYPDKKIYVPWVPRIVHKTLTPGLPVGRTPVTGGVTGQKDLCLCAFFFPDFWI